MRPLVPLMTTTGFDPPQFGDGKVYALTDSVWTAATPIRFAGTWFPHVMTVVRLRNGELLLHSPCRPLKVTIDAISRLGNVAHIVAPNWFHDLYLAQYKRLFADATFWAPGLLQWQHKALINRVLDETVRPPWFDEMPHVTLTGLLTFDESLFYHEPSRTLLVADFLMNGSTTAGMPAMTRLGYRFFGLDGTLKVFPILRWFGLTARSSMKRTARQILRWAPERLVVGHGAPIQRDATTCLQDAFAWLRP